MILNKHALAWIVAAGLIVSLVGRGHAAPIKYEDTFIHTHVSIPFSKAWADEFIEQVREVRPDVVEVHATRLLDPEVDIRKQLASSLYAKQLSEQLDFNLALTVSLASTWRPEYDHDDRFVYRVQADGSRAGRWGRKHLCLNAPAVDEVIIPTYARIAAEVKPWQVWIDENVIGINLCYCPNCTRLFKEQTGMDPPTDPDAPDRVWDAWVDFHRHTFEQWTRKIHDTITSASPETIVTFNHAYFLEQPQATPGYVVNLCADVLADPLAAGLYANYGAAADVPYDIMTGLGDDIWAGIKPKRIAQVKEDIAVILANGGRWNIGEFPTNRTTLRQDWKDKHLERPVDEYVRLARGGAAYARARQAWTHKTRPVPYAGVLLSARTHYSRVIPRYQHDLSAHNDVVLTSDGTPVADNKTNESMTRIYWPGNRYVAKEIVGAYEALLEHHVPFNIINQDTWNRDREAYRLLVIPSQFRLDEKTKQTVARFVHDGGVVLVTGSTLDSGLLSELGIPGAVSHDEPATLTYEGSAFKFDKYYALPGQKGDVLYRFDKPVGTAAAVCYPVGDGKVVVVGADIFDLYQQLSPYGYQKTDQKAASAVRGLLKHILDKAVPDCPYQIDAPADYEVTIRTKAGATLVNLVDRSLNWKGDKQETGDIALAIKLPERPGAVTLQPQGLPLAWRWEDGRVKTEVPVGQIDVFSIVEIK